jgi:hypothetical protein
MANDRACATGLFTHTGCGDACRSYRRLFRRCADGFDQSPICAGAYAGGWGRAPMCQRELRGPYQTTVMTHPDTGQPTSCDIDRD